MIDKELEERRIKGAIVGLLLGDAVGIHYYLNRYNVPKGLTPPPMPQVSEITLRPGPGVRLEGTYSNSTALALCTMATINELGNIDFQDLLEKFHDCCVGSYLNYDEEDYFMGNTTVKAIKNHNNGMPMDKCGLRDEQALDDEVLARMLPIGLYYATNDLEMLIDRAHSLCQITHNSYPAKVCSVIYCLLIRNLLLNNAEKVFDVLLKYYEDHNMPEYAATLQKIREHEDNSNNVMTSFWNSWRCFAKDKENFKLAVSKAALSQSASITCSIVGSLCGINSGLNDIPSDWLRALRLGPEPMEVIESFVQKVIRKLEKQS